ncbi:MAG: sodium:proton antiporter NhaD [Acidobacteriota bacterium]|jgi:Na+/H+ antiporter NhaD/arsenite permease-like protein|nr:MAG: sodium:proton antiporter [Acidobacteriota bacterium]
MLTLIVVVFILGYLAIALEHQLEINKAAAALLIGAVCWALYAIGYEALVPMSVIPAEFVEAQLVAGVDPSEIPRAFLVENQFLHLVAETAYILFFLMGAMTIVELVDAHEGFSVITRNITSRSRTKLLWIVSWLTFFTSAVLDNLTTTIVMISLLRKVVPDRQTRLFFAGMVIVAANAGGAWTVIGDVTTTMLWIRQKIGPVEVMRDLFLPSVVCLLVPLLIVGRLVKGEMSAVAQPVMVGLEENGDNGGIQEWHRTLFLVLGVLGLLSVPVFKAYTHLPPFVGMMLSLAILWIVSEFVDRTLDEATRSSTGVVAVLKRIDMATVLFFLGILLAVGALAATGVLPSIAVRLDQLLPNRDVIAFVIGLVSAVVDNVPLVAAGMDMYDLPMNHRFWMLLAYSAGTGGSCLVIGSAAGVAAMGLERIDFLWYARKIGPFALLGYIGGALVFLLQHGLL